MRIALALCFLAAVGCDADGLPCDRDQRYSHGLCYDLPVDAAIDADPHFGAPCTDSTSCAAPTDFCLPPPGGIAYCTRSGCLADPTMCPTGWTCVDLSVYQAGLPAVCIQP